MIHVDVKKVGRIRDGGGWRAHGRGSAQDRATRRQRAGYIYLHSATDDHSRLTYTEELTDERCDRCRVLATRREMVQTTPDRPDPPSSDRQRLLLPVMGLRRRAGGIEDPPQTHPPLLATNQRVSRALPPHHGHRMALLTKLDQQPAPPPRAPGLARPLQLPSTTQLTRRPTTHQPLHLEHRHQPPDIEQLQPQTHLRFVNADVIAAQRWADDQEARAYDAARLAAVQRRELIAAGQSFIAATVFSLPSK